MTPSNPPSKAAARRAIPVSSTPAAPCAGAPAWRTAFRNLPAMLCAGVLALGLAGCGGGGGQRSTADAPTPADVIAAFGEAVRAVDALTASPGTALLRAAEDAIAAAKKAVEEASGLSDADKRAHNDNIAGIEEKLEAARERVMMARDDEVARLRMALAGDRIATAATTTVEHGEAPTISGEIPGTPPTTVTNLETTALTGSAVTAGGWTGGTYIARDESDEITDTVVFYTDIEAPGTQPFSGDEGKYGTDDGIDGDGNLEIGTDTDATLIASSEFPTGPGIREHEAGAGGMVEIDGTFDGADGTYVCTPTMSDACTSSIRSAGGIALMGGGGWKFAPDEGAMVAKPDTEYSYFGWWQHQTEDGGYAFGAFHDGVGGEQQEFEHLAALQSQVQEPLRYRGPAAGKVVIDSGLGPALAGEFTAEATLEVDFGDDSALGTVTGTVDEFIVNGDEVEWSVELQSAAIGARGGIEAGGTDTAGTVWSIDDEAEAATGSPSPTWSGQLHDVDEDEVPTAATGMFEATYGEVGHMVGAFGTTREP